MTTITADKSALEKGQAKPQVLLTHHLKALRLPTFLSQFASPTAVVTIASGNVSIRALHKRLRPPHRQR